MTAPTKASRAKPATAKQAAEPRRERVFSGIAPSGTPTLGNYIGAIRNWVAEQDIYDNIFCVVDLHAITVPQDPAELRANTRQLAALLFASGIDPKRSVLFVQSHVSAHAELAWILNCVTPTGWLNRMTQFKVKAGEDRESVSAGLYVYPVLMAADILLYQTDVVPVGDDQVQHVELTRDIANTFNFRFGETFVEPKARIREVGARIMALDDPAKKMSKSGAEASYISLVDPPTAIRKKIARATTDSERTIVFDENRPGIFNLLTIYQALGGETREQIEAEFAGKGYKEFKAALADLVVATLEPVQQRYTEITADPAELDRLLAQGAEQVRPRAEAMLKLAKERVGLL
ncbi:MAG: Tryptophanyl-tRNA synthetase [Ktedonobacterales bacterium]|jgi:tryptophanyl-tRNA synthetase|nr:MAG: Tryptophanyl-tRNA synthetase [Ktedonobacterales bacterium]